jgi:Subtilase family/FG-GAP-like repeat
VRSLVVAVVVAGAVVSPALAAFPQSPPNDPLFDASPLPNATNEQWDLASPAGGFDRGISADRAWPLSIGAGTTIADIDLGVELGHPDLESRWAINPGETGRDARGRDRASNGVDDDRNGYVDDWRGWDFYAGDPDATSDTGNNHGTNVAGVLGAATDNGIGIAGIAPGARILPLRTADNILHSSPRLAAALVYAADRGAEVASMSLGAETGYTLPLGRAAAYAHRKGMVMVAAIGNEFHFHHEFPATLDEVIAVGGLNPDTANQAARDERAALLGGDFKLKASYSDFGPHIDVVAPTQVPTTNWGGGYRMTWDGTSAAAPHVAATAALVISRGRQLGLRLTPDEVRQLIRQTADDLADRGRGFRPGWDQLSGWGRVNTYEAVRRVAPGRIPPGVDITAPSWYRPAAGRFEVRGVIGGRSGSRWTLEVGEGEEPGNWQRLAEGSAASGDGRGRRLSSVDARSFSSGGYTLRLRARDADGNLGEDRAYFFAVGGDRLKPGYPKELSSGESSPVIADVRGDGAGEIVLATSDGLVRVMSGRTGRSLPGWPRRLGRAPGSGPASRRIGAIRASVAGTPAVGDITGGSRPEVVVAATDGRVYVWQAGGRRVRGFPVRVDLRGQSDRGRLDGAVYASPALADLDRDGRLDIVVGAADQKIYAWRGDGSRVPGWPVTARDEGAGDDRAKILSSPAIGDLDGDGSPDVVEGTAEVYGSTPATTGRVYAFSARGRLLPGWPIQPGGLAADSIPLAGEGVSASPVLADVDGDGRDEVAISAFSGQPQLFRGDGSEMYGPGTSSHFRSIGTGPGSPAAAPTSLSLGANSAFGRLTRDGPLRLFGGLFDGRVIAAQLSPATHVDFEYLLGGWDAATGEWLPRFPRLLEGWPVLAGPAVADVDGDGAAEVIAGSSGYLLHAFSADGSEPPGWPKQTGGWLLAAPAVGDVDGDGRLEVIEISREGNLFVWDTPARAGRVEWSSLRHDPRNTGRYGK